MQYGFFPTHLFIPWGKEDIIDELLSHGMKFVVKHGGIVGTIQTTSMNCLHHIEDIENSLQKYEKFLEYLPRSRPPDKGVKHKAQLKMGATPNMI